MRDTLYFLSYDLIKGKDYKTLYDELNKFGAKEFQNLFGVLNIVITTLNI